MSPKVRITPAQLLFICRHLALFASTYLFVLLFSSICFYLRLFVPTCIERTLGRAIDQADCYRAPAQ
jgi:hypothetical protein